MITLLAPAILALVLVAISERERLGGLAPWMSMGVGALAVLALGAIGPAEAFAAIDWNVMLFLYGMLLLGRGLEESGYLRYLTFRLLQGRSRPGEVTMGLVLGAGLGSALLLNDTLAIVGTPVCLALAARSRSSAGPLLIALALAVTVGSVLSPIGNPQNYLIASQSAFTNPFAQFLLYLGVPAGLGLLVLGAMMNRRYPALRALAAPPVEDGRRRAAHAPARAALGVVVGLSLLRLGSVFTPLLPHFELFWIALAGAGTYVLLARRAEYALRTDWETLAFFAAMFVLTQAVWDGGFFQSFLPAGGHLGEAGVVVGASLLLSQVLSNVPFVIFYLKALGPASPATLALLAMASTMAGAITIIGAASNIIIIQTAAKRGERLPTREFMEMGIMTTALLVGLTLGWMGLLHIAGI